MKKLLLTGASGFVGKNIAPILSRKFSLTTLGRGNDSGIVANLARGCEIPAGAPAFDLVIHAAGKAHSVPRTAAEAQDFFDVNFTGTQNLCAALDRAKNVPADFVFISTVAVYGCASGENIDETHALGGNTPYAKSKIAAENFLENWCEKRGVCLTILRPSLIAGANAPGNLGAMVRGIASGRYLRIGRGNAKKSVVMVEDLAHLALLACGNGGIFNACSTEAPTFAALENLISAQLGKRPPRAIPFPVAKILALAGDCLCGRAPIDSARLEKITRTLTFSNAKARRKLSWNPLPILENYRINGGGGNLFPRV